MHRQTSSQRLHINLTSVPSMAPRPNTGVHLPPRLDMSTLSHSKRSLNTSQHVVKTLSRQDSTSPGRLADQSSIQHNHSYVVDSARKPSAELPMYNVASSVAEDLTARSRSNLHQF